MSCLELISFKICPFAQRALIALDMAKVECKVINIDLQNKPEWFLKMSPLGSVPVLKVGEDILYDSNVIIEYLNDEYKLKLLPDSPMEKATYRSWTAYASSLFMDVISAISSKSKDDFSEKSIVVKNKFKYLESHISQKEYFLSDYFSLVDISLAPMFHRLSIVDEVEKLYLFKDCPKLEAYSNQILSHKSFIQSIPDNFNEMFKESLKKRGSFLF